MVAGVTGAEASVGPFVRVRTGGAAVWTGSGNNDEFGTGAKVVGPVRIGAGGRVGANAVVVSDVAAGTTVVGAPAREVG